MEKIINRIASLLSIKSLVTLILTGVFAYLSSQLVITGDQFLTVYAVVIAFYFGTQYGKQENSQ